MGGEEEVTRMEPTDCLGTSTGSGVGVALTGGGVSITLYLYRFAADNANILSLAIADGGT